VQSHLSNIDSRGRGRRRLTGIAAAVVSVGLLTWFLRAGISRWWRLLLFVPVWIAAVGLFQAHEST
jgi:hypothetical protein